MKKGSVIYQRIHFHRRWVEIARLPSRADIILHLFCLVGVNELMSLLNKPIAVLVTERLGCRMAYSF